MLRLRPIEQKDQEFLRRLYASTRQEELAGIPWSPEEKDSFLEAQFLAQHTYYQEQFPEASFDILQLDDQPIGRAYVKRSPEEIRIIDISLLPEYRGQGIGGRLIKGLIQEATGKQKPVRFFVEAFNPAMRLYRRLGFEKVEDHGIYHLMEWNPVRDVHVREGQ